MIVKLDEVSSFLVDFWLRRGGIGVEHRNRLVDRENEGMGAQVHRPWRMDPDPCLYTS